MSINRTGLVVIKLNVQEINGQLDHFLSEIIGDMAKNSQQRRAILATLNPDNSKRPNVDLDIIEGMGWTLRDMLRIVGDLKSKLAIFYSDWKASELMK